MNEPNIPDFSAGIGKIKLIKTDVETVESGFNPTKFYRLAMHEEIDLAALLQRFAAIGYTSVEYRPIEKRLTIKSDKETVPYLAIDIQAPDPHDEHADDEVWTQLVEIAHAKGLLTK